MSMPTAAELERLAKWACLEWKQALVDGRLVLAGDLPNGAAAIGISGNRITRNGFIKDDPALGCRNLNSDGSASFCCTFAVLATPAIGDLT